MTEVFHLTDIYTVLLTQPKTKLMVIKNAKISLLVIFPFLGGVGGWFKSSCSLHPG